MQARPRILVVEDEPGIADTLLYALRTDGFDPRCVGTGAAALDVLRAEGAALVILDVGLPDRNGLDVFRALRGFSDVPVMFLTARSDEIDRVVGLELGADDYVAKPFSPRELVARVRGILRRSARVSSPAQPGPMPFEINAAKRRICYYGAVLDLSRYEYGLLKTLIEHPGHVFSRDTLLDKVWDDGDSGDRTVDAHVKTLRAKLKAIAPALEPIRTHRGSGYALAEDLPAAIDPLP